MDLLLRELRAAADQGAEFLDHELSAKEITIGSSQDQLIRLIGTDIGPRHAVLQLSRAGVSIKCQPSRKVLLNGKAVRAGKLANGDSLQLGGHELTVIEAPAGFDAALELQPDRNIDTSAYEGAYRTSLADTWLSKRLPAWTLVVIILLFGLLIPAYFMDSELDTAGREFLPTDSLWTSGPLHPVHNVSIGDDCSACHRTPFQRVQDEACTTCHVNLDDHILPGHESLAMTETGRCATCHKEHNEPGYLIVEADALCTDCHAKSKTLSTTNPHLQNVTGFSKTDHPSFEVAMLFPTQQNRTIGALFDWQTVERKLAGAEETSNLKFPHDRHLDVEKVRNTHNGSALGCVSCHVLSLDREHFVPITMERNCQHCHELNFDLAAPERQLPHGNALEVILAMEGHFLRVYSDPNKNERHTPRRRVPDKNPDDLDCKGTAFTCAAERTRTEVANQFEQRGCITCHRVENRDTDDIYNRYQVYPVRLSEDFIPNAKFDHHSHLTQKDAEGDAACLTCHPADNSVTSSELLIPDLDNCLGCHSDRQTKDKVPLDCIGCHAYHPLDTQLVRYLERAL